MGTIAGPLQTDENGWIGGLEPIAGSHSSGLVRSVVEEDDGKARSGGSRIEGADTNVAMGRSITFASGEPPSGYKEKKVKRGGRKAPSFFLLPKAREHLPHGSSGVHLRTKGFAMDCQDIRRSLSGHSRSSSSNSLKSEFTV